MCDNSIFWWLMGFISIFIFIQQEQILPGVFFGFSSKTAQGPETNKFKNWWLTGCIFNLSPDLNDILPPHIQWGNSPHSLCPLCYCCHTVLFCICWKLHNAVLWLQMIISFVPAKTHAESWSPMWWKGDVVAFRELMFFWGTELLFWRLDKSEKGLPGVSYSSWKWISY
jgi:hypothetical protein